jgi:hypothetical protein
MSYRQIFRRANRILKSKVNDLIDHLTLERKELNDFDEELKRSTQGGGQGNGGARQHGGTSAGSGARPHGAGGAQERRSSGYESKRRESYEKQSSSMQGRRKPGEKEDAFYFSVLGLKPDASVDEIKHAYKRLMRQHHPDRVAASKPEIQKAATEKAKAINEAYHIIARRRGFK